MAKVRVVASTPSVTLPTVNVVTSDATHTFPVHAQLTVGQQTTGVHRTFQDSGGTKKGLKTIVIPGYTGPS